MSKELLKYCLAIVGVILGWAMVVPSFEFPDEQAHFGSVEFLTVHNRMPQGSEMDMTKEMQLTQTFLGIYRNSQGQNSYTYHPEFRLHYSPGQTGLNEREIVMANSPDLRSSYVATEAARYPRAYYDYTSFWDRLVWDSDIFTRLFALRASSLILTLLMAYVVYLTGYLVFRKKLYAATLTVMVMLEPMMSFLSAGVNSDNLHNMLFFLVIYGSLRIIISGLTWDTLLLVATASTLDIFTKPQGFIALPLLGLAIIISVIKKKNWSALIWILALSAVVLTLAHSQLKLYFGLVFASNIRGLSFIEYLRFSSNKLLAQNVVWYWGVFKWLGVVLPPIYWRVANRVVLLSVAGIAVYWWRIIKKSKTVIDPFALGFLLLASIIYALAIYWFDWQYSKTIGYSIGIQARYFFPTILAHMAIMMTGILSLGWNELSRLYLQRGLILLFVWLQLGGLWRIITSYYSVTSLPEFITQLSQYKPDFAKGSWWYLWIAIYLLSLAYLAYFTLVKYQPKTKS